jgi:hypothetical protein
MEPASSDKPSTPRSELHKQRLSAPYHKVQGDQLGKLRRTDVMPIEEVRWWLNELMDHQGWKVCSLSRALGLASYEPRPECPGKFRWYYSGVRRKANGKSWIFPHERVRMSKQLERIISGEIAQIGSGRAGDAYRGAIADVPQPIRLPLKWHINLGRRDPLEWRQSGPPPRMLPNFRNMLEHPRHWDGNWEKNDKATGRKLKYYGPWK